jgi:hypothetical protein
VTLTAGTPDTPPPAPRAALEGNTDEENLKKDRYSRFVVAEFGLTGGQIWAATLDELARQRAISRADVETWLRPARLVGREGATLIVGAPNGVAREQIERRLIGPLREALAATVGRPVGVTVVVDGGQVLP